MAQDTGFKSGFAPFPKEGGFPISAPQNFWQNNNLTVPGQNGNTPIMNTSILQRFPELNAIAGGRSPNVGGVEIPTFGNQKPFMPAQDDGFKSGYTKIPGKMQAGDVLGFMRNPGGFVADGIEAKMRAAGRTDI